MPTDGHLSFQSCRLWSLWSCGTPHARAHTHIEAKNGGVELICVQFCCCEEIFTCGTFVTLAPNTLITMTRIVKSCRIVL